MPLPSGVPAPEFTLADQDGVPRTLSSYKGSYVLLYFYPKDDTPGCTLQACAIEEQEPDFRELDTVVLGVSVDSVASHKKFATKYGLRFPLLSDELKHVVNAYGVWGEKSFMGKKYQGTSRTSFLIDPTGNIVRVYENVKPEEHTAKVLKDLRELRGHG